MPIYEYECSKCKAKYELQQSFSAESTHTCEECGKGVAKRVLHAPRVVFKGSGFYVTDSKGKSTSVSEPAAGADGGGSTADKAADKSDSGTETTAAT